MGAKTGFVMRWSSQEKPDSQIKTTNAFHLLNKVYGRSLTPRWATIPQDVNPIRLLDHRTYLKVEKSDKITGIPVKT